MNKIGVIGLGHVGMEYVYSLINSNLIIDEIVIIDTNDIEGKILDLKHSLYSLNKNIIIKKGDYYNLSDADIVCITAGVSQSVDKKSRDEDLIGCFSIFKSIIPKIKDSGFNGIYLIASNPLDVMCYVTYKIGNINPNKIIGSGTLLDTNRLRIILSEKYNKKLSDINGLVLGEHGFSSFIPWHTVNIKINKDDKNNILNEVKKLGFTISSYQGYTAYGISSALLRITSCILNDTKEVLPTSTYLKESDIFISTPSMIGRNGLINNDLITYTSKERKDFINTINTIKSNINKLDI